MLRLDNCPLSPDLRPDADRAFAAHDRRARRQVQIYAKRDDCNSGLAMGGNKLRKLEYIVPDAIASNADTLVSIGGVSQPHPHGGGDRSQRSA